MEQRSPAFQFYPKDFLADENVRLMSLQERGAYITLLCLCWTEGTLPADTDRLARLCGVPHAAFRRIWPALEMCFRPDSDTEGRLIHPRLHRERQKQAEFKRRQSDNGKKGGRPPKQESQNNPSLSSGLEVAEPRKSSASSSAFASANQERVSGPYLSESANGTSITTAAGLAAFDRVRKAYPRKDGNQRATEGEWRQLEPDEAMLQTILDDITKRVAGGWADDLQYVPLLGRYLRERKWTEPFVPRKKPTQIFPSGDGRVVPGAEETRRKLAELQVRN
jgi:uncharacterized protein YdaU (DUF1376 family)